MSRSLVGTEFRLIFDNSNDNNNAKATLGVAPPYVIVVQSIRSNSRTTSQGSTASVADTGCNFISVQSAPAVSPLAYASRYFPSVMNVISQAQSQTRALASQSTLTSSWLAATMRNTNTITEYRYVDGVPIATRKSMPMVRLCMSPLYAF